MTAVDTTTVDVTRADRPWRRATGTGVSVWGAAALSYFLINCLTWMTRNEAGPPIADMLDVWNQWDTGHYVNIAQRGYDPATENPAFFPLYPLLMRILDPVLPGQTLSAGLIISNIACIASLAVLYRLTEDLFGPAMARRTTFYLMAYPFAFFLSAAYNESLFLLFSVASLYCMRRGHWWAAGLIGALASATRQAGVLLALAFVVEYLRQRDRRPFLVGWNVLAILLVPVGIIAYAIFCWQTMGDPLKFVNVQSAWGREANWPWEGAQRTIRIIEEAASNGAVFQPLVVLNVIDLLAVVVTLVLLVLSAVGPWRLSRESLFIVVFGYASLVLVLVSPIGLNVPLHGVPRYALEILPAFMVLARIGANRHAERFYVMPAIATQGVLVLAFYYDIWLS